MTSSIDQNLKTTSPEEKTGAKIATNLTRLEDQLIELYSAPPDDKKKQEDMLKKLHLDGKYSTTEGAIEALTIQYQRALRTYDAFVTLMKTAHDTMMSAINQLRLN